MDVINSTFDTVGNATNIVTSATKSVFSKYYDFLLSRNVVKLGTALIISSYVTDLSNSFTTAIISPILNYILTTGEVQKLDDLTITIRGIKLEIGKLIQSILKFIIMTFIIFLVIKLMISDDKLAQILA